MKIKDIIKHLDQLAPSSLQESYDNSGLIIGDGNMEANSALISLDLTAEVLEEAIQHGCGLVITHHPLIFSGLKKISGRNAVERMVIRAIKNDLAIYAIHTNLDNVAGGVNEKLGRVLGLQQMKILEPLQGRLNKLVTFCPEDHADTLRKALFEAGAGHIGNYDSCSFNVDGRGTFRGAEDTHPFVGEAGKMHTEAETRIELIFPDYLKAGLISALKENHPYEEVAFDIYPLENEFEQAGAGMIGLLAGPMDERAFIEHVKAALGTGFIRHSAFTGREVRTVAICGGSGAFLINKALRAGADAFVTGDVKYHQFFEADGRMMIIDAGHYETEQHTKDLLYSVLNEKFPTFALRISQSNTNAVHYY